MANKTKSVTTEPVTKETEVQVNFGNVEALKLRLLSEINAKLGKLVAKMEE